MNWQILDVDDSNFECEIITITVCPDDVPSAETSCDAPVKVSPVIENREEKEISLEQRNCLINLFEQLKTENPAVSDEEAASTLSHETGIEHDSVWAIITRYLLDRSESSSDVPSTTNTCSPTAKIYPVIKNRKGKRISLVQKKAIINLFEELRLKKPAVSKKEAASTVSQKTGIGYNSVWTIITRYLLDHVDKSACDSSSTATSCTPVDVLPPATQHQKGKRISLSQKNCILNSFEELRLKKPGILRKEAASTLSQRTGIGYNSVWTIITRYLLDHAADSTSGASSTKTPCTAVDLVTTNKKGRRISLAQKENVVNLFKELKMKNLDITKKEAALTISQKTGIGYNSVWTIILRYLLGNVDEPPSGLSLTAVSCNPDVSLPPVTKNPSGKIITLERRICVVNLFKQLRINKPDISKREATSIISQEMGIGYKSVWAIISRYLLDNVIQSPNRKRIRKSLVDKVDSPTKEAIRNKIQPYLSNKESISLNKLLTDVNTDDSLPNFKRTTFYKLLQALGLQFQKIGKQCVLLPPSTAVGRSPVTKNPKTKIISTEQRNCILNLCKELKKKNPDISKTEAASTLSKKTGIPYNSVCTIINRYLLDPIKSSGGAPSTATMSIPAAVLFPVTKNPRGKIITLERRICVVNLFKQLKIKNPFISKKEATSIISQEMGIGHKSVWAIINQYLLDKVIQPPNRKRIRKSLVDEVDSSMKEAIRNKIELYFSNEESPSLNKLLANVNADDSLPNFKRSTFYKLLKALGLQFQKGFN